MKLLLTGASGFIGNNIYPLLVNQFDIVTVGMTNQDDYNVNLAESIPELEFCDVVLHAAGKAHTTPKTEHEKMEFFKVNLIGTQNLCLALERCGIPKSFIFISSVAVYGLDSGEDLTEDFPLRGESPYALSKIKAEAFLIEWCSKNNVKLGIIRPSLIAGPGAPGNLGAMITGIKKNRYLSIANGKAKKSVLMVQDIAYLVPLLMEHGGIYNVCANRNYTFRELEECISSQLGKKRPFTIPLLLAKLLAFFGDYIWKKFPINSLILRKITSNLTFSNSKARHELKWMPLDVLDNFHPF